MDVSVMPVAGHRKAVVGPPANPRLCAAWRSAARALRGR